MPRKPRLSVSGALHHVMARGIEGRPIFHVDDDRLMFLSLLAEGIDGNDKGDFLDIVRMSNNGLVNRHDHRCWVIGEPEFVRAALEHDHANRLQVASFSKSNVLSYLKFYN